MPDDLPQPKDEYWLPSLRGPLPARNIPQYQPPQKQRQSLKQHWDRADCVAFTLGAAAFVTYTMSGIGLPGTVVFTSLGIVINLFLWFGS